HRYQREQLQRKRLELAVRNELVWICEHLLQHRKSHCHKSGQRVNQVTDSSALTLNLSVAEPFGQSGQLAIVVPSTERLEHTTDSRSTINNKYAGITGCLSKRPDRAFCRGQMSVALSALPETLSI